MDQYLLRQYFDYLRNERRLSALTLSAYQRDLGRFTQYCTLANLDSWLSIDAQHIRQCIAQAHRKGLGGRSLQRLLSAIRSFYKYLQREGIASMNPAVDISAPKSPRKLPTPVDVDQMSRLLQVERTDPVAIRDWAMMEIMYSCGLRLAELVSLNLGNVDLRDHTLPVTGKGAKTRILPVGRLAVQSLNVWLTARLILASPDEQALFVSQRGTRISARNVQQRMHYWGLRQGVDGRVHPHRLRHSFASHMLESSGDLRAVQELLGHADISTTQVYTHLDFQHLAKVYDAAHPRARLKRPAKAE